MKVWLRVPKYRMDSWSLTWINLAKALRALDVEIHQDPTEPKGKGWIELWCGNPTLWRWASGRKFPKKVAMTVTEGQVLHPTVRSLTIQNINKAQMLLTCSYAGSQAYREAPIDIPIHIVPLGIDTGAFSYCRRYWEGMPFKFLLAGVYQPRKGSWLAIEAFLKAFPRRKDVKLTIWTTEQDKLMLEHRTVYSAESRIVFTEQRYKNPRMLYHQHHVLLSPHLGEGFGLIIPEAMSTGMPCLISRCSAPREYLNHEVVYWIEMSDDFIPVDTGYYRLPSVDDMAEKMSWLYKHRKAAQEKGKTASKFVEQNLKWEYSAKYMIECLKEVS